MRGLRIFLWIGGGSMALCAALGAGLIVFLADQWVRPPWYEHRTPAEGLIPLEGTERGEESYLGIYRDPRADFGLDFEEVEFPTEEGLVLRGWLVPAGPGATLGVITVHAGMLDRRQWLRYVGFLNEAGFAVLLFDQRDHGISGGHGRGISLSRRASEDVMRAVDFMKEIRDFEHVAVLGSSQGGTAAIIAAARDPRIDAVVTEGAYTTPMSAAADLAEWAVVRVPELQRYLSLLGAGSGKLPQWLPEAVARVAIWRAGWRNVDESPPWAPNVIHKISPRPLLLIHGSEDDMIPLRNARELFERAREPKHLWIVAGSTAGRAFRAEPDEYRRRVLDVLRRAEARP